MVAAAAEARLTDLLALLAAHHDRRCGLARQIASRLRSGLAAGSGLQDREGTALAPP